MSNLKHLGTNLRRTYAIHPTGGIQIAVETAIRRNLSTAQADRIIHGYKRSSFSTQALLDDYQRGNVPKHDVIKDWHYYRAIECTAKLFKPEHKYRPVSYPDLRYYPWPLNSSAEAPFSQSSTIRKLLQEQYDQGKIDSPRLTFHNLYNHIFIYNRQTIHRIKDGIYYDIHDRDSRYWNTAHARSHLVRSDEDDKIRMVYGVPKNLLQVEAMFLWPLINDLVSKDTRSPMLWGCETLKGGWYKLYNWFATEHPACRTFLAFDWKQFDKRAQFTVIDDIHDIMKSYINFDQGYIPTGEYPDTYTEPARLHRLWNWMCDAIKHTPDLLPTGEIFQRQHAGIASGFFQTQLLDSMYNCIMMLTILSKMGFAIEKLAMKLQGDDSLIGMLELIPEQIHSTFMETFGDYAQQYFGAILNAKKSKMSNSLNGLPVLGFTNINSHPQRNEDELLASLLYPERNTDQPRLMARSIGMVWASCGISRKVYRVCEDVYKKFEAKGFSPNMSGLPDVIKSQNLLFARPTADEKLPTHFPSFFETFRLLSQVSMRSRSQKEKLWPTEVIDPKNGKSFKLFLQSY